MSSQIEIDGNTLRITRLFNAPRPLVFEAWSDPEKIAAWSGCEGATSLELTADFRVGGQYRHVMQVEDVCQMTMTGTYTEIEVPSRIAYTLKWAPFEGMPPIPESAITVEFQERGQQTEVRLTHSGLITDEMKANVPGGWQAAFEKLANGLEQVHSEA